jgi:hypothetical protein
VGFPQPSEAVSASSGNPAVSVSEYRFDVIGSAHPHAEGPQQLVPAFPVFTAVAMAP